CCMYSTKQAIQTMDHGVDDVTTLYMDIRAYGKNFDAFYQRARDEGAEYRRGRPAAVDTSGETPVVRFEDTERGELVEEAYDMVVLSPALIPSAGTSALADVLDIELDDDGFIEATEADGDMIQTTREGVYAAGCATGPKDIPDSVAEASGAASKALEHVEERTWPEPIDVEPVDVSGEERVGVIVCDCGTNIADTVNVPEVVDWAADLPNVEYTEEVMFACAGNTQEHITEMVKEHELNRLIVASCSPKTHGPTFERVVARAGLNEYLLEMANIRNHNSWVHDDNAAATEKAKDMVKMAVDKASFLTPLEKIEQPIEQRALVVGGGIAGMTAATSLAQQGNETHLVEREPELGGMLRDLHTLHPSGKDADALLDRRRDELDAAGVTVHTATDVENVSGYIGNFAVDLSTGETLDVGAIVLATGAGLADVPAAFADNPGPEVITNRELEARLADGGVDADRVTFVGCVGSRDGERGCSRYCCQSMVGQANRLAADGAKVNVVSKDIRTFTRDAEEAYRQAAERGVRFFRYDEDATPEEALAIEDDAVVFDDVYTGETLEVPSDLVVLAMGLRATGADEENDVAQQLTVSRDEEDFLLERHPKLGPAEASVGGVFMAGSAQSPKDVRDATDQALGAAAKAGGLLAKDTVEQEPLVASIDPEACTGCTRCAMVCPYNAVEGEVQEVHSIIEAACMGCGTCAAECPTDAITMPGFTDEQIEAQIDAALETNPEEKVITFACNWCSYAGADQAGIEKRTYPPGARIIRTMCSGRVDEDFVDYAFEQGAGAVLMSGCHIGDCHYIDANTYAKERYERKKSKLERDDDFDEDRLQLEWISAAEGRKFADKMTEMDDIVARYLEESGATPARADGSGFAGDAAGGCGDCGCGGSSGDDWLDGGPTGGDHA
ncbi:MAG: hydrogenase iron-sulfur subunit, partial [Halobacteriales archaeon]